MSIISLLIVTRIFTLFSLFHFHKSRLCQRRGPEYWWAPFGFWASSSVFRLWWAGRTNGYVVATANPSLREDFRSLFDRFRKRIIYPRTFNRFLCSCSRIPRTTWRSLYTARPIPPLYLYRWSRVHGSASWPTRPVTSFTGMLPKKFLVLHCKHIGLCQGAKYYIFFLHYKSDLLLFHTLIFGYYYRWNKLVKHTEKNLSFI